MIERHAHLLRKCMGRIRKARVMVAGVGGLGSTVAQLLARLDFRNIVLVDPKIVDEPDLNRQILYTREDLGKKKVEVARNRLLSINPHVQIETIDSFIDDDFELPDVDVVVDCLDSFKSRFVLEEKVFRKGIPLVHGGVKGYGGQVTVVKPHETKSLREIFGDVEDDPAPPQVFPPIVTLIGSIQASEVVKLVCGEKEGSLMNRILVVDLSIGSFDVIYLG